MKIEDIYRFFQNPPLTYLGHELAVGYVLFVLLQGESYGIEILQRLEVEYPTYRLSDTILYSALEFLESEKIINAYWKKVKGQGGTQLIYRLDPEWIFDAAELARLWRDYTKRNSLI